MYLCNEPVCSPVCDFCRFCEHDRNGAPMYCIKGKVEELNEGLGYCDEFKCSIHEKQP